MKRYLVTGGAGHLGRALLTQMRGMDCQVRALLLPGQRPRVDGSNIRYIYGDVCDFSSLLPLLEGWEGEGAAVFHTAALISIDGKVSPQVRSVNVDGTKNILRLCAERGAGRLVHVSSVHAIPLRPEGQAMAEVSRFSPEQVEGGYAKTKAEAAQAVLDASAQGLDAVTVFPSGIIGPYNEGENHLVQLVRDYLAGRLPLCVRGGYDFVDVRDVARGCLLAAERGRTGEGYLLTGRYVPIRELLAMAGGFCGRKAVPALPIPLARAAVPLVKAHARLRGTRPLYTAYSLYTLSHNGSFSHEKAGRELGWEPRPTEETVRDMVCWLRGEDIEKTPVF